MTVEKTRNCDTGALVNPDVIILREMNVGAIALFGMRGGCG